MIKKITSAAINASLTFAADCSVIKGVAAAISLNDIFNLSLKRTSLVTFDSTALNLNLEVGLTYKIVFDEGFVLDPNNTDLINPSQEISFTADNNLELLTYSLKDDAILDLEFNKWVQFGELTSNISLYTSTGTLIVDLNPNDSKITFNKQHCYVNFGSYLSDLSSYYVLLDENCITDLDNFGISAVTNSSTIAFTTSGNLILSATPSSFVYNEDTVTSNIPDIQITDLGFLDSTGYTLTVTPSATAAVYQFNTSAADTLTTNNFNSSTKVLTLSGTRTAINNHIRTLSLTPGGDYVTNFDITYSVVTPRSTTKSKTQTAIIGTQESDVSNITQTRTYLSNQGNYLFTSNTPVITDTDPTESATYTITLQINNGLVGLINNPVSTYSFTGTKTQVNTKFAQLMYYPNKNFTGTGQCSYTQTKSTGSTTLAYNFTVINAGSATIVPASWTMLSSGSISLSYSQARYGNFSFAMVGGGGGGGGGDKLFVTYNDYSGGGGGGGGGVVTGSNLSASSTTIPVTVGAGGQGGGSATYGPNPGTNGGNSSVFAFIAYGGLGGLSRGGTSGAPQSFAGGQAHDGLGSNGNTFSIGGGGGGAGGAGSNAIPNASTVTSISGGVGISVAELGGIVGAGGAGNSNSSPTSNTGGGGGGGYSSNSVAPGRAGARGKVVVWMT